MGEGPPPLLAREGLPAVCGQWAKVRLPSGEPIGREVASRGCGPLWPCSGASPKGVAKGGQWGIALWPEWLPVVCGSRFGHSPRLPQWGRKVARPPVRCGQWAKVAGEG